jgi:predicted nucleic acid-binding protein
VRSRCKNINRFFLSHGIGTYDILIAHTALELGAPLHTFNVKHFGAVAGLKTIQPYIK